MTISGSGHDNRHIRLTHEAPGHASYWDAMSWRAEHYHAHVELVGGVEDRLGYVAFVGFTDQSASGHARRTEAGHDLIDGAPAVSPAVLAHHRRQPREGEFTNMQHHDVIGAVTNQLPGRVSGRPELPDRLAWREIYG
jgi:hypothetical protein